MSTRQKASWIETDNQTNALATATRAAIVDQSHFITGVSGSFSAAAAGITLILKEGSTEKARWHVTNQFSEDFGSPIQLDPNNAANLELAAGGATIDGSVNLKGYTL